MRNHRRLLVALLMTGVALAEDHSGAATDAETFAIAQKKAAALVSRMTLDEKIGQMQNVAPAIPRLNIPAYDWWNEGLHGVARAGLATVFPQAIGLAATFDFRLEHRIGDAISTEARAKYNDAIAHGNHGRYYGLTFWSPNINIFRDPRWGRGQETFGEDPYLTARMALEFIKGMQGSNPTYLKTVATAKHFAVHSGPENVRHGFNAAADFKDLDDTYLYAFRIAVADAHVGSVMCAYNSVNGTPACANTYLLTDNLREASGFQGYIVSDCGAVADIYKGHQFADSMAEAAADAVKAGTDLDCGSEYKSLREAVHKGFISEAAITKSAERLFTARFRLGMFDPPEKVLFSKIGMDAVASPRNRELALDASERSIVLLKNEGGILPLKVAPKSIAVVGPAADDPDALLGNYNGTPSRIVTPLEGLTQKFSRSATVRFALGSTYVSSFSALIPQNALTPAGSGAAQAEVGQHGLRAEYFSNEKLDGQPLVTRVEQRGYFVPQAQEPALTSPIPGKSLSLRWTANLQIDSTGKYDLGLQRPDCETCPGTSRAKLYLNDKMLVETTWKGQNDTSFHTGTAFLEAGQKYDLRVEYTHTGEAPGIELVWRPPADALLKEAVHTVNQSDLAVVVLGLNSRLEGEESKIAIPGFDHGDRTDLNLPESQEKLLKAVLDTGKPTIVILINGSALAVQTAQDRAKAILEAWYPGQEGGLAIANTISGDNNPAARLPVTFYKSATDLPQFTDYSMKNRTYRYFTGKPLYPFGYGLSYSDFRYSDVHLQPSSSPTAKWEITAKVTNISPREGDEVVQLYLTGPEHKGIELRGIERVHLEQDQIATVRFLVSEEDAKTKTIATVGSGQPLAEWTGNRFVEVALPKDSAARGSAVGAQNSEPAAQNDASRP